MRKNNFTTFIFSFVLIGIASLLTGAFGDGGGCLGTQEQIHTVAGSSGFFILVTPSDGNVTTLEPVFSWGRYPADLTSYTLQISTDILFGTYSYTRTNIAPNNTSFPSSGGYPIDLDENTDYYWRIIAVDSDTGTSTIASGAPFKFTTGLVPGPFNLTSPANGTPGVSVTPTLSWTPAPQRLNYIIQIDTKTTFNKPLVYDTGPDGRGESIQDTTYTIPVDSQLSSGVIYYWRVIAENTGGSTISGPAAYWSFTTQ